MRTFLFIVIKKLPVKRPKSLMGSSIYEFRNDYYNS